MTQDQIAKPQKKRTAPRDVRQRQLIMAAMDSISKRGFSATTLRHVTEKAKLSHGVVNYHFASKEALYDATLGYLAKEHYDLWNQNLQSSLAMPANQLAAIIKADFDKKTCTHKKLAVWFAFWGQAKYRPNYLEIHSKYDDQRTNRISQICAKLIEEGNYIDLTAQQAARTIDALSDGLWLNLLLYPSTIDRDECFADCMDVIASMFPDHFPLTDAAVINEMVCAP